MEAGLDGVLLAGALEHGVDGALGEALGLPRGEPLEVAGLDDLGGAEVPGQLTSALPGLDGDDRPMPCGTRAAMDSAPMGPTPITMTRSPSVIPARLIPWRATAIGSASAACREVSPAGRASSDSAPMTT